MINKKITELSDNDWEFISQTIDKLFIERILFPRESALISFFVNILNGEGNFQLLKDNSKLEIIEIIYSPESTCSWFRAEPCEEFYPYKDVKNSPEISFDRYFLNDIAHFLPEILDENKVDYSESRINNNVDFGSFWTNMYDLEITFILACWRKAKNKSAGDILGFLVAGNSSNPTIDLDKGKEVINSNDSIEYYLTSNGINASKHV